MKKYILILSAILLFFGMGVHMNPLKAAEPKQTTQSTQGAGQQTTQPKELFPNLKQSLVGISGSDCSNCQYCPDCSKCPCTGSPDCDKCQYCSDCKIFCGKGLLCCTIYKDDVQPKSVCD
jgi:hypothetical protein